MSGRKRDFKDFVIQLNCFDMKRVIVAYTQEVYYSNEIELTTEEITFLSDLSMNNKPFNKKDNESLFDKITEKPTEDDRNTYTIEIVCLEK